MHFKKDNLLGKFVKEGWCTMDYTHRPSYNFCDFFKAIAWGLLWSFVFFYFAGWLLVFGIAPWIMPFFMEIPFPWSTDWSWGHNLHAAPNVFFWGAALVTVLFTCAYVDHLITEWRYKRELRRNKRPPKPIKDSWYQEAYQAFKEKYCPLVTFEE